MAHSAKVKVCQQTICPHFRDCPFALDLSKCRHALAVDTKESDIEEID
jgi:hypothetical protein